jgi:hypothetical protein
MHRDLRAAVVPTIEPPLRAPAAWRQAAIIGSLGRDDDEAAAVEGERLAILTVHIDFS